MEFYFRLFPGTIRSLQVVEFLEHLLLHFCPRDYAQLSYYAREARNKMRRRPTLVTAFWTHAVESFRNNSLLDSPVKMNEVAWLQSMQSIFTAWKKTKEGGVM